MSRMRGVLFVMTLLSLAGVGFADQAMTAWRSFVEVTLSTRSQDPGGSRPGLARGVLSAEVLEQSRDDLADLRLLDVNRAEIPFAVRVRREISETRPIQAREFNRAKVGGGISEIAVDIGEGGGEHNEAEIRTEGQNFRRQVELDGSDDGQTWRVLTSAGTVFNFEANNKRVESDRISYPVSRYRYLRARVTGDSLVDRDAPAISSIAVMMSVHDPGEAVTWNVAVPVGLPVRAEGSPASAWLIDLGHRVPCNRIFLDAGEQSFSRPFSLELADDPQNVSLVASGEIRRRTGEERKPIVIDFDEVHARRLRLILTDFANPQLNIGSIRASAPARQLLFEVNGPVTTPLRLFAGNSEADPPRYDFEKDLPARLSDQPVNCEIGFVQPNPSYRPEPKPLTERLPWLIYCVLAISSISLALILISLVRSTLRTQPAESGDAETGEAGR